jgi:GntR family transcriptional regulator, rspAB operon transcriptional repressor
MIRERIIDGGYAAGATLSQVRLAREIGVSRTTLREALRMLEQEGLIESEFNRRVQVASFSPEDLAQIYSIRIPVEAAALRIAVPMLGPEDLDEAERLLDEIERLGAGPDPDEWNRPHRAFHLALLVPSGPRMLKLAAELHDHAACFRVLSGDTEPQVWNVSSAQHRALLDACRDGDAELAAVRLAHHHAWAALTVLSLAAPEFDPAVVRTALSAATGGAGPAWPAVVPAAAT